MIILCESVLSTFGQGDARLEWSCPQGYHTVATSFEHCLIIISSERILTSGGSPTRPDNIEVDRLCGKGYEFMVHVSMYQWYAYPDSNQNSRLSFGWIWIQTSKSWIWILVQENYLTQENDINLYFSRI